MKFRLLPKQNEKKDKQRKEMKLKIIVLASICSVIFGCRLGNNSPVTNEKTIFSSDIQINEIEFVDLSKSNWLVLTIGEEKKIETIKSMLLSAKLVDGQRIRAECKKQLRIKTNNGQSIVLRFDPKAGLICQLTVSEAAAFELEDPVKFESLLKDSELEEKFRKTQQALARD